MRAIVSALAAATRATLSLAPVIVVLWLAGLAVARVLAEPWAEAFERFLAHAPDARTWLREWHPAIVDEFLTAEAAAVESGADALRRAALPWIVGWTVVSGGIVAAVAPAPSRGLLRDTLRFAHRFAWLLVCTVGAIGAIGWLGAQLDGLITSAKLLDPERDRAWLTSIAAGKTLLQLTALHVVLSIHRFARVRVAVLDERFVPRAWLAAARAFAGRAPVLFGGTLLAAAPLAAASTWAWRATADTAPSAAWVGHLAFLAVVAALVFRTAFEARMWPLYGPAWRAESRQPGAAIPAVAGLVLTLPLWIDDASAERVTRAEILDDVVVAETRVDVQARADLASLAFVLDGDAQVVSARIADGPLDLTTPPTLGETASLPLDVRDGATRVTLPALVPSGDDVALTLVVSSPRAARSRHGAEVLDAIGLRLADHVPATLPARARLVIWSREDLLVEATGGAAVVGTDGAGRSRAAFTADGVDTVRAVAIPRAVARSSLDGPLTITIVGAPGVLRTHDAVLRDAAAKTLSELNIAGHEYPHDQLTLVLDPTPSPPRAHGATWCVVPVSAIRAAPDAWIAPLVSALAELTGARSTKLVSAIAHELTEASRLPTSTPDALRAVLTTAVASGAWSADAPTTDHTFGILDACGWWRSPFLTAAPLHAAPLAEPWRLADTLHALRGPDLRAWGRAFGPPTGRGAALVDARTTGGDGTWTHMIVVERSDLSLTPDVELLFSNSVERTESWPDDAGDRWELQVDGGAPLVSATLRFDDATTWLAQPWHDDARLATPDHGAAEAMTHVATRWNELALWGWAAVF